MVNTTSTKDPFYYLFPLGIVSSIIGVALWAIYNLGWIAQYPRQPHASLMFFSFLVAFVSGFLMTAIPKMTGTNETSLVEKLVVGVLLIAQWPLSFLNEINLGVLTYFILLVFMLAFIGRRFMVKKQIPFEGFVFIPIAFLWAIGGIIYFFTAKYPDISLVYKLGGEAFVLNLVCGLGARLIPVLSRLPQAINPDIAGNPKKYSLFIVLAALLNFTFVLEIINYNQAAYILRFLFLTYHAVAMFGLLKQPTLRTYVGWGLKVSVVSILLGYLLASFNYLNPLASLHLVYIGGFTLISIMIGTRVTLAHSGKSTEFELNSTSIFYLSLLFFIVAILRFFLGSDIQHGLYFLIEALYIIGMITWFVLLSLA